MVESWRSEGERKMHIKCKHCGDPCLCDKCFEAISIVGVVMGEAGLELTVDRKSVV